MTGIELAHDGVFLRRLAHLGASRGPEWLRRYSPPLFGCAAALAIPKARQAVLANLRRIRGKASPARDAIDVARTFSGYASCLAEVLSGAWKRGQPPEARYEGKHHLESALANHSGAVFVTAHTGGWEIVGPLLFRDHDVELVMVMESERDVRARQIHDAARIATGVHIVHVGEGDPFASLPLLRHLRNGAVVALQVDRVPAGMKTRPVTMFGAPAEMPEGPLRLAQLSGAPLVPIFATRTGYGQYLIQTHAPVQVARRAKDVDLDRAAQVVADAMSSFLTAHPTHWFHFCGPQDPSGLAAEPIRAIVPGCEPRSARVPSPQ